MKKLFFTITMLITSVFVKAQTNFSNSLTPFLRAGIKVGPNINKINGTGYDQAFNLNYHLGGYVQIKLTERIGIQPELIFSQSTAKTVSNFHDIYQNSGADPNSNLANTHLNYLNIPLLANFGGKYFKFQVGPQYSILMSQDKNLIQNGKSAFKNGDFSMIGGLWFQFGKHLNLSGRYVIGLSNVNDLHSNEKWKNQGIQLGIGYSF